MKTKSRLTIRFTYLLINLTLVSLISYSVFNPDFSLKISLFDIEPIFINMLLMPVIVNAALFIWFKNKITLPLLMIFFDIIYFLVFTLWLSGRVFEHVNFF